MAIDNGESENPKVYDPTLGKERDAFPGEVVAPEQQSTLQRLMVAEDAKYQALVNAVSPSGQFSPEELNVILRAGKVASEAKRLEYLEGIRSNPATIIQAILKQYKGPGVDSALTELDRRALELIERVRRVKVAAEVRKEEAKPTKNYFGEDERYDFAKQRIVELIIGSSDNIRNPDTFFGLLQKLELIPNPEIKNLEDLYISLPFERSQNNDLTTPYTTLGRGGGYLIYNLESKLPGLEGVYSYIKLEEVVVNRNGVGSREKIPRQVFILGNREALVRIVDRGPYIPSKQQ